MTSTILTPVAASERIVAMDVVRGFALLGILLMNIEGMAGPLHGALTGLDPALAGADRWADALVYILVQGKFYTLFSLLFGMGFAVMMARAEAAGRAFTGLYLRRSLGLLAIGLAHALLVWSGDILVGYALVGLVLLWWFRHTPTGRLPAWGITLYLLPSLLMLAAGALADLGRGDPAVTATLAAELAGQDQAMQAILAAQTGAYGGGSYADAVVQRLADLRGMLGELPTWGWQVLGMFVLGSWWVRSGAMQHPGRFPRVYRRLRWWALPAGLALMLLSFRMAPTLVPARLDLVSAIAGALAAVGSLLLCLAYLGWIMRGLASATWAPRLAWLAPAGRMALSNYLAQSLLCTWIFYGYGLGYFGQLPRVWQPPLALAIFCLQVLGSRWWLLRFRFGPVEWLWRAVTYRQWPRMRQSRALA